MNNDIFEDSSSDSELSDSEYFNKSTKDTVDHDSFLEFVKQNSTELNMNFVREFLDIVRTAEVLEDEEQFCISGVIICKWLEIDRLSNLIKSLKLKDDFFEENEDYIIEKIPTRKIKGPKFIKTPFLTVNCFKELCFLYNSKKSKQIRSYYIQMEKLLRNLKDKKLELLEQKIKTQENNKRRNYIKKRAIVYFF